MLFKIYFSIPVKVFCNLQIISTFVLINNQKENEVDVK